MNTFCGHLCPFVDILSVKRKLQASSTRVFIGDFEFRATSGLLPETA
jgi:hypothetical protein